MGNSGACCSSDARCCGTPAGPGLDNAHAPMDPLSDEVRGIDQSPTPGVSEMKLESETHVQGTKMDEPENLRENETEALEAVQETGTSEDAQERQHVTYSDGSTYTGLIKDGKRHGHGVWQSKNCQYEGEWQADSQHGQGRQSWSDGRVYDGQFQAGRFSGFGKMVWHTQNGLLVYEGEYKDDLKDGQGKFIWPDGRTYDGEWSQGKRHGKGTYITAKADRKVGFWVDDKFQRWENIENMENVSP